MIKGKLVVLALIITLSRCNIWDNIYSQSMADTPIVVSQSLNFKFQLRDNLDAKIDFNAEIETVTVFIYINMLIEVEILKAQLDLTNLVVTIFRMNTNLCERYNIAALKNMSLEPKISQQRLFLINLFFKYIGKSKAGQLKKEVYNIYKLQPFLFTLPSSKKLKELEQSLKNTTQTEFQLDDDYFNPDIQLFLHVNSKNGNIESIYTGQNQASSVPFSTNSVIRKKFSCESQIHSMTTDDLKKIFDFVQENRKSS